MESNPIKSTERIGSMAVDAIICMFFFYVLPIILKNIIGVLELSYEQYFIISDTLDALTYLIILGYLTYIPYKYGTTIGKKLFGLRLLNLNHKPIKFYQYVVRIVAIFPYYFVVYPLIRINLIHLFEDITQLFGALGSIFLLIHIGYGIIRPNGQSIADSIAGSVISKVVYSEIDNIGSEIE